MPNSSTASRRPAPLLADPPPVPGRAAPRTKSKGRKASANGSPRAIPAGHAEDTADVPTPDAEVRPPGNAAGPAPADGVTAAAEGLLRTVTRTAVAACLADPGVRRQLRALAAALLSDGPPVGGPPVGGPPVGGPSVGESVVGGAADAAGAAPPRAEMPPPAEAASVPPAPPASDAAPPDAAPPDAAPPDAAPRVRAKSASARARPALAAPTAPALPPGTGTGRAAVKSVPPVSVPPVPVPVPAAVPPAAVPPGAAASVPFPGASESAAAGRADAGPDDDPDSARADPSSGGDPGGHRVAPRSELDVLPDRLRLKAKAARWAAASAARSDVDHATLRREAHALEDEARELGTWLWTTSGDFTPPEEPVLMKRLVEAFEVTADAVEVLREAQESGVGGPALSTLLNLGAEAQSMLRAAVRDVAGDQDRDQVRAYVQVKEAAAAVRHYVRRHLREEDPADPACAPDLARRLVEARRHAADSASRQRVSGKAFGKLKHVAGKLDAGEALDPEYEAQVFAGVVGELLGSGVPPSDRRFREVLPDDPAPLRRLHDENLDRVLGAAPGAPASGTDDGDGDADGDGEPAGRTFADVPDGIDSLSDAVTHAGEAFGEALAFSLNRRSEVKDSPFEAADAAFAALRFLATTFRDAKRGARSCPDLDRACRETCGFHYSGHQSDTTMGQFPEFYETTWAGASVPLKMHLKRGCNSDPRHTLRIAFHWDEPAARVVVGYIGQHQRTRQT